MVTEDDIFALNISERTLLRNLPPILADIARVAGMRAAIKLGLSRGGGIVYFPGAGKEGSVLASIVGEDAARKLCDHFADGFGAHVDIPNCLNGATFRRLKCLKLLEDGASGPEAARAAGVSRRTVVYWKSRYMEADA